jgi:hypothetical protein
LFRRFARSKHDFRKALSDGAVVIDSRELEVLER